MATGKDVTHAELEAAFYPLGEWPTKDTRDRIDFIIAEGEQAPSQTIRDGLPQSLLDDSYPVLSVGGPAPAAGLSLTKLDGSIISLAALFAADAAAGKASLLNFGSYT